MLRTLLALSLLANATVLATAAWLIWGTGGMQLARSFLVPQHERWVSQWERLAVQPGDVVFLGDSITEGGSWHELFPGVAVRNRGIAGDTTAGVLGRLDPLVRGKPGKLFLQIGTNDLSFGDPPEPIAANVAEILARFRRGSPDTQLYVQSVLPRQAKWADRVEALNAELERVAFQAGATWIDLYPHFFDESDRSIRDDLANDELHLLGDGYLLWRSLIEGHVRAASQRASSSAPELEPVDLAAVAELVANDSQRLRLINVWATWCAPCLAELPLLVGLSERYRELDVVTLSIDAPEQHDDALAFLTEIGASTRNWIVRPVEMAQLLQTLDPAWGGPLPYTLLVAPGGSVAYRRRGAFDPVELEAVIVERLAAQASHGLGRRTEHVAAGTSAVRGASTRAETGRRRGSGRARSAPPSLRRGRLGLMGRFDEFGSGRWLARTSRGSLAKRLPAPALAPARWLGPTARNVWGASRVARALRL